MNKLGSKQLGNLVTPFATRGLDRRPAADESSRPTALVVGRRADDAADLESALVQEGWGVEFCEPSARASCPLLEQPRACSERTRADVVVVYVDTGKGFADSLPLVRCAADSSSPSVIVLEKESMAPASDGNRGLVGALRTTRTIVDTVVSVSSKSNWRQTIT